MPDTMRLVRQIFPDDGITDHAEAVRSELRRLGVASKLRPGMRVAIGVGSRGIAHYAEIVASLVSALRAGGAQPFIVPAMGSHAGGTAESQQALLISAGFDLGQVGAPIRSSMETVSLGRTEAGFDVRLDRSALEADALVVVNRVKPHTDFYAPVESGILKMLAIGLGKREGAAECHRAFVEDGFYPSLGAAARLILSKVNLLCGLAIVENERHETLKIEAIGAGDLFDRESALLSLARSRMARIPFRRIDLLVVDEIGKDISGSGMDPNVIGRKRYIRFAAEDEYPKARFIYVRGLSASTHGNATGIGIADLIHERVYKDIDFSATNTNCLTSGTPYGAAVPMRMRDDRAALEAARAACRPGRFRIVRVRNTLALDEMWASEDALVELESGGVVEVDDERFELRYGADGDFFLGQVP